MLEENLKNLQYSVVNKGVYLFNVGGYHKKQVRIKI
jgi:hypothetical protein